MTEENNTEEEILGFVEEDHEGEKLNFFVEDGEVQPLVIWPDERLKTICEEVTEFDNDLKQIIMNMFTTAKESGGIGLAANQIGVNKRIVILDFDGRHMVFVNPEVVVAAGEFEWEEGCLSVPGYFENRTRPQTVVVKYQNMDGVELDGQFTDLGAFAIQHEIDHLNGKSFVDNLSMLKRMRVKSKIKKTPHN